MIKTFRGKLASSGIDTISLHTNTGSMGYRIKSLKVIPATPGTTSYENVIKIYKISQSAVTGTIDFADQTLLAVAYMEGNASNQYSDNIEIVFDKDVINQDIYVTNYDVDGDTEAANYYIELEQVKLDLNQNTVATLKDIRNITV